MNVNPKLLHFDGNGGLVTHNWGMVLNNTREWKPSSYTPSTMLRLYQTIHGVLKQYKSNDEYKPKMVMKYNLKSHSSW